MSKNISKLSGRKGLQENLFSKVKLPGNDIAETADQYLVGKSTIYGSKTFYDFLNKQHSDKKAWVCSGSSCLCSGDQERVTRVLENQLGDGQVGRMTCLGRCYDADSFQYDARNFSGGANGDLNILDTSIKTSRDYEVRLVSNTAVLTDGGFHSTETFREALLELMKSSEVDVLGEITKSGLRGRGGAGFPAGTKWDSCRRIRDEKKFVVCNGDEGDPGAFSDRYLMEEQPYRVCYGMLVAAWIVGAKEGVIYVRAEYPESVTAMQQTVDELKREQLLGNNIADTGFSFEIEVVAGAGAYVCGEETALIASIEGRRPEVDVRPPFPTEEGLYKKPTVLNNVETFAAIQRILAIGGDSYAQLGSESSTGTKLLSLDAGFNRPGIVEVEMGLPLRQVIDEIAMGFKQSTKAIHIGGPLGGLVPVSKIDDLSVDFESFSEHGFLLGHASFVCIPDSFSMMRYLEHLFEFTRDESCGKCFPCRLGSTRGKEMFSQALEGEKLLDRNLLDDLLTTMQHGSLCALGGGLPLPVWNALMYFEDELSAYFENINGQPGDRL